MITKKYELNLINTDCDHQSPKHAMFEFVSNNYHDHSLYLETERVFCFSFKSLNTNIVSDTSKLRLNDNNLSNVCPDCGEMQLWVDAVTYKKVCQNCGFIADECYVVDTPPRVMDKPKIEQHNVLPKLFKRKTLTTADLKLCSNSHTFQRMFNRDGYYDVNERKRTEVDTIFNSVKHALNIPQYIIDHAWNHYIQMENTDLFIGKNKNHICYALIYISLLQNNRAIQIHRFIKMISDKLKKITKKDLYRNKNSILNTAKKYGYNIGIDKITKTTDNIIEDIITALRQDNKPRTENDYYILYNMTKRMVKHSSKLLRYHGSIISTITSIMYYISRVYDIPLSHNDLLNASAVSPQTIQSKYKIIVSRYGNPETKLVNNVRKKTKRSETG